MIKRIAITGADPGFLAGRPGVHLSARIQKFG
jgi:hypothetical protein